VVEAQATKGDEMNPFATELLIDDRVRERRDSDGPEPGGTTRIAAMLRRHEDEQVSGAGPVEWTAGPIDQRRNPA